MKKERKNKVGKSWEEINENKKIRKEWRPNERKKIGNREESREELERKN